MNPTNATKARKNPIRGQLMIGLLSAWVIIFSLSSYTNLIATAYAQDVSGSTWSETDSSNNATPPSGWPAGMFPNQVEPTARANMGALKRFWNRDNPTVTSTGSAGAYAYATTNTGYPAAYVQGEKYAFKANFTSVGADTLAVNSLAALPIYKTTGSGVVAIQAGDIQAGAQVIVSYDSALNAGAGGFQLLTPAQALSSLLSATHVVSSGTSYTMGSVDQIIAFNSLSASAKSATISACSSLLLGRNITIKDEIGTAGIYAITLTPASGTIDGRSSYPMSFNFQSVTLTCDGSSNWMVN
jgi:hypothetical protein